MKHLADNNFNSNKLENVPTPINDNDAANKAYVDSREAIYGSSRLKSFRTALGSRGSSPVDILFIGDSKTEGNGSSTVHKRWMTQFIKGYQRKNNPQNVRGGYGYVPAVYGNGAFSSFTLAGSATAVRNYSGNGLGLGKRCVTLGAGGTLTITFSATNYGTPTAVDILYTTTSGSGTFNWSVNGGSTTAVSAAASTSYGVKERVTGFRTVGNNTLIITGVSGTVTIEGFMHYDGDETSGIRAWDAAHSGTRVAWVNVPTDVWWNSASTINPDLIYISLGRNDFSVGTSVATIRSGLEGITTKARTLSTNTPSIIFGMDWKDKASIPVDTYENFYTAMKDMVKDDGDIAFFDSQAVIGTIQESADDIYDLTSDYVHLNDKGQQIMADAFMHFIEECVGTIPPARNAVTESGGWYTYDLGTHREHRRRVVYSTGALAAGAALLIVDENLPSGVPNLNRCFWSANVSVATGSVTQDARIIQKAVHDSTKIQTYIYNGSTVSRTWSGVADLHLVENP